MIPFLQKGFFWIVSFCFVISGLITIFLGHETDVPLSPVEQELCILDSNGSSEILIGGDSRATYHLMPSEIMEITPKKNIDRRTMASSGRRSHNFHQYSAKKSTSIGKKTTGFWGLPNHEKDYLLEGGQLKNLKNALAWLSNSSARKIILYNAPIDSGWLRNTDGPIAIKVESRFSEILKKETSEYPKVVLLDFLSKSPSGSRRKIFL